MYALIKNGIVENCIVADAEFVANIQSDWDAVVPMASESTCGLGWAYSNGSFVAPTQPLASPPPPPEWEWLLDIGPFSDRLGMASVSIDLSTIPGLVAIRADFARRKWIDLKDARVIAAVYYLAGQAHPALGTLAQPLLTVEQAAAVVTTKPTAMENMALRKLYFS